MREHGAEPADSRVELRRDSNVIEELTLQLTPAEIACSREIADANVSMD